ncbi:hypothetical protein SAMN04487843_103372 [Methylobacterium sp. ap11]|uniref:hypothetical protein n=1 Tax=Methylobacterium sp. ap11 TaxID=1761799 RepID=UPI0008AE91E8|nr:hypothetical protein [Methylobacterium sp. ap11]SEO75655.1 hypothetical protein SAMN04487843_103372 [Methylobacterium sp. ap11]
MSKPFGLAAAALVLAALSIAPASAHGRHHDRHHGRHPHGYHPHGHHHGHEDRHGRHGWGGWHGDRYGGGPRIYVDRRPVVVRGGGRPVFVDRRPIYDRRPILVDSGPRRVVAAGGYPVYVPRPGDGCSTRQRVGLTEWGMRKVVTTRTCIVP